jgi:hypothetical protein
LDRCWEIIIHWKLSVCAIQWRVLNKKVSSWFLFLIYSLVHSKFKASLNFLKKQRQPQTVVTVLKKSIFLWNCFYHSTHYFMQNFFILFRYVILKIIFSNKYLCCWPMQHINSTVHGGSIDNHSICVVHLKTNIVLDRPSRISTKLFMNFF